MQSAGFDSQGRFVAPGLGKDAKSVDEAKVIELSVGDPGVVRIPEQVIHPINPESISHDDLRENGFPRTECLRPVLCWTELLRTNGEFGNVFGRNTKFSPHRPHFVTQHEYVRESLVVPASRVEFPKV